MVPVRTERFRLLAPDSPLGNVSLVLASESPRRRALLQSLGLQFTVQPAEVDERKDLPEDPEGRARTLAIRKARVIAERLRECIVLAADTIVVRSGRIYGKPGDREEAIVMLSDLTGGEHQVITAVCAAHGARERYETRIVSTAVRMNEVGAEEIRRYVDTGEPFGKAGAYAIQGLGGLLVTRIEGDYSNVVGLPLSATLDLLEEMIPREASAGGESRPAATSAATEGETKP
jgi:septum formation protein